MPEQLTRGLLFDLNTAAPYQERIIHHQLLALVCAAKDAGYHEAYDAAAVALHLYGKRLPEDTLYAIADELYVEDHAPEFLSAELTRHGGSLIAWLNLRHMEDPTAEERLAVESAAFRDAMGPPERFFLTKLLRRAGGYLAETTQDRAKMMRDLRIWLSDREPGVPYRLSDYEAPDPIFDYFGQTSKMEYALQHVYCLRDSNDLYSFIETALARDTKTETNNKQNA